MAVKFSQFTQENTAANVTELVGYTASGNLNVRIGPDHIDTVYAYATAQSTNDVDLTLTGTKTGTSTTTDTIKFTAGSNITLTEDGAGGGFTIANTATYSSWNLVGDTGTPQAISNNDNATFSSANAAITTAAGSADTLTITSVAYSGTTNIGHVPTGGSASTFLRGDGTWQTPGGGFTSWTVSDGSSSSTVSNGEIVTFTGGTGITSTESSRTVTLDIDYVGADNAILAASAATVAAADTIWFSDADDSTIKNGLVSDLPFNETLQEVCTAGNTTTTAILTGDGTVSLPSFAFTTEPDTGMYRSAANALALVTGGAAALTIDANQNGTFNSTGATTLPVGDDAARPTPTNGMIRYSTTANGFEGYINGAWGSIGGGVTISKEQETGDGTTTDFTLTTAAGCTVDNLAIYISGVYQNKLDASGAANFTVTTGVNPTLQFVSGGTPTAPPVTAANGIEIVITR